MRRRDVIAAPRSRSALVIQALLAAGGLLAVALLAQTVLNYQYVSNNLIRQEARRVADERVRNVERTARTARPQDADAFRGILDDLRKETGDETASIALVQSDGTIVAASGPIDAVLNQNERARFATDRAEIERTGPDRRELLISLLPCRCGLPRQAAGSAGQSSRQFLAVAIYRDSLSAPFARLRRNAAISASAALALLLSVSLIALRFGPYVRGRELEVQMDVARQVQRDLLPASELWPAGVDVAAECLPASQVGGDFYDVVALSGGRLTFTLGDVSGHGISAALLMSLIHGSMSSPPWGSEDSDPQRAAARLNALLLAKSSGERYASLFWCVYDPATGVLSYINAGHPPPVLIQRQPDGTLMLNRLSEGGSVLGLLSSAKHSLTSVTISGGDLLILFSDGIVEAANGQHEQFGEERLMALVQQRANDSARAICKAVVSATQMFSGRKPPQDDQTVLVVRLWRSSLKGQAPSARHA